MGAREVAGEGLIRLRSRLRTVRAFVRSCLYETFYCSCGYGIPTPVLNWLYSASPPDRGLIRPFLCASMDNRSAPCHATPTFSLQ